MRQPRLPESCEFREPSDQQADRSVCGLARRFAGRAAKRQCYVDRSVCEACCRHDQPSGPRLNPVVASLVLAAAQFSAECAAQSADDQVANFQTRQFALRWLAACDDRTSTPNTYDMEEECDGTSTRGSNIALSEAWQGPATRPRIGLVGRFSRFGFGHLNIDIAQQLAVDRWLVPRLPGCADLPLDALPCRTDEVSRELGELELEAWLDGLDAVIFAETPVFPRLAAIAKQLGVRVVCVPMWEALHAGLEWLDDVDLMLSPTRRTASLLADWKERFHFPWRIELMPWPVNVERFPFRRRYCCSQFIYVHGSGGAPAITRDDAPTRFRRKGLAILLAAAREVLDIPIIVYGFPSDICGASANVAFRPHPSDNSLLYSEGDVCIQPSHWEGLGLPLLECQAAGMPLVTTDAPPMNEHRPLALIPAVERAAFLSEDLCITAAQIQPDDLARVMRRLYGRGVFFASGRARRFVVREHNWRTARPKLLGSIARLVSAGRTDTLASAH